jgi:hypothetical protein
MPLWLCSNDARRKVAKETLCMGFSALLALPFAFSYNALQLIIPDLF